MIGARLKLARTAAGLSLRGLAAAIDHRVTAQAIGKYERNETTPGSATLIALADVLDTSVDYLLGYPDLVLEDIEFRKHVFASKRSEAQVQAAVLSRLEGYLEIEELLGLSRAAWNAPLGTPYPVRQDLAEAEDAATAVRQHWGFGNEPIPNLVELLEEQGVKVFALALDDIHGVAAKARRDDGPRLPVVVVNESEWGERQRFTAAHELGHMILEIASPVDTEKAAHRFAGAFLMPAEALFREVGRHRKSISLRELVALKSLFGVSLQALTYRCKDLRILSQAMFRRLFDEYDRRGWRKPPYKEPLAAKGDKPNRFERLVLRAYSEAVISSSKAAELLGVPVHGIDGYLASPPSLHGVAA